MDFSSNYFHFENGVHYKYLKDFLNLTQKIKDEIHMILNEWNV